jgi:hypothetical protein
LNCTNGLRQPEDFVAARGGHFMPAQDIGWFQVRHREWIDAFVAPLSGAAIVVPDEVYFVYGSGQDPSLSLRTEYLEHALQISTDGDASVYLLNPVIVGADGEWEAWFFANWHPGAERYRSFAEMVLAHHEEFRTQGLNGF